MEYDKEVKTVEQQVATLMSRGLLVKDESILYRYLENISYYHLSVYFKHFQLDDDTFIPGTNFDDVINIYVFDQKLRLILQDVLERIENSFKAQLVNKISIQKNDPFWIVKTDYFNNDGNYTKILEIVENLRFSKEIYIKHYYLKYTHPETPPAWMILESLTFGQTVLLFRQLSPENKEIIALSYGLNKKFIESWFYAFSEIRNICAHHSRLWNREMRINVTQKHPAYNKLFFNNNGNRLFNHILLMNVINKKFSDDSEWLNKLFELITNHNVEVSHMGFPKDWRDRIKKSN